MGKLSNITNAQDSQSIQSRVFVGNVNTSALSKAALLATFLRYGRVRALSVHRGYAFVQYSDDEEARAAAAAEDQRVYAGQPIGEWGGAGRGGAGRGGAGRGGAGRGGAGWVGVACTPASP